MRESRRSDNVIQFPAGRGVPAGQATGRLEEKVFGMKLHELECRLARFEQARHAFQAIQRDFEDPDFTLGRASRICGVERNHLNTLLRESSGQTFHQLLIRYRILKSARLLRETDTGVLDAAACCGFRSIPTFYRNFRRLLHCTPRSLRKVPPWQTGEGAPNREDSRNPDS